MQKDLAGQRRSARALLCALLCFLLLAASAQAQKSAESQSRVEYKNRAPVSKDLLSVKLPPAREVQLANGLTVLIIEDHRFPFVTAVLDIEGSGALNEPPVSAGLARATAQLLRFGTKTRHGRKISQDLDQMGAQFSASAEFGSSIIELTANGLSDNFDQWFAIFADVVINPTFPPEGVVSYKQQLKAYMQQQRGQPYFLLSERFNKAVFGAHPAATIAPTPASLDTLSSESLTAWRKERIVPQNAILGIIGDLRSDELIEKLNNYFHTWEKTTEKSTLPRSPVAAEKKKIYLVDRAGSVQTSLLLGNISVSRRDEDYFPFVVLNRILGDGTSSRLFRNLREEKGYTYNVYSYLGATNYPGSWQVGAEVRNDITGAALGEILIELRRLRDEKVSEEELAENRRALAASFTLSLENPEDLIDYAVAQKRLGLASDYWEKYPARILAVTSSDVQRVARKYLDLDAIQIVAVGDATQIKTELEKFGPIEIYRADGEKQ